MLKNRTKNFKRLTAVCLLTLIFFIGFAPAVKTAVADGLDKNTLTADINIRCKPGSVFNIPFDASPLVFDYQYKRTNMINRLCIGYTTLPRQISAKDFSRLSDIATSCIGIRYVPAGKSPSEGFDCSGFVLYVLRSCGSGMTAASCGEQYSSCVEMPKGYEAPGDIVFFKGTESNPDAISHVGLYLGDGKMIHAGSAGISVADLSEKYWTEHFFCIGRPTK